MSTVLVQGKYTLGQINVGLSAAMALMVPVPPAINLMLTGQFGLVPMSMDFKAQLNAALSVGINWNPMITIKGALDMVAALQANLIPQISINASAIGDISLKLGGIQLLIDMAMKLNMPIMDFLGSGGIGGQLTLPGIAYVAWKGTPGELSQVSDTIRGLLQAGPTQEVYCIALAATDPKFATAASLMFKMS